MSMFKQRSHEIPGLNTASLPDLIFSVLFFFMIVTHMRQTDMKVQYKVPKGNQIEKLTHKQTISYIYIGESSMHPGRTAMQLNDKLATKDEIADYISAEKSKLSPDDVNKMKVSIKADAHTKMGVINDVKQALRQSYALKIVYCAEKDVKK